MPKWLERNVPQQCVNIWPSLPIILATEIICHTRNLFARFLGSHDVFATVVVEQGLKNHFPIQILKSETEKYSRPRLFSLKVHQNKRYHQSCLKALDRDKPRVWNFLFFAFGCGIYDTLQEPFIVERNKTLPNIVLEKRDFSLEIATMVVWGLDSLERDV